MPCWRATLLLAVATARTGSAHDASWRGWTSKLQMSQLGEQWGEQWQGLGSSMRLHAWHGGCHSHNYPPIGALYSATLGMPVIGGQTFMFKIVTRRRGHCPGEYRGRAQVTLKGAMNLDEPADFYLHRDGTIDLRFNEPTLALLSRMRTRIVDASYSVADDFTELVISPPLWRHIRVKLRRQSWP